MAKPKRPEEPIVLPKGVTLDKRGTPTYDVVDPSSGDLLIRVGHYHDPDITKPIGMARFLDFLGPFGRAVDKGRYASLVLDSGSFASLSARKYHQYDLNEDANDPRQWYGGATDMIEEILAVQLPALECNVGVAMHVSKVKVEAEGTMVRSIFAPGRLKEILPGAYPELYRLHVERQSDGAKVRFLQTDGDERWQAGTCIDAPDDVVVHRNDLDRTWKKLWSKWTDERHPWHGIIYAEPHAGKSTCLAMLPKPIYVGLFDAVGKDAAYRRVGKLKLIEAA